jgi:hypothetical protein
VQAFQKGQNQGLVLALQKMKAVGRITIPGTLGNDVSFISMTATPTGRRIRFITNRPIRFGEAFTDSPTQCASPQSKTHQEQCILKRSLTSGSNFSVALNGQAGGTSS